MYFSKATIMHDPTNLLDFLNITEQSRDFSKIEKKKKNHDKIEKKGAVKHAHINLSMHNVSLSYENCDGLFFIIFKMTQEIPPQKKNEKMKIV